MRVVERDGQSGATGEMPLTGFTNTASLDDMVWTTGRKERCIVRRIFVMPAWDIDGSSLPKHQTA